MGAPQPGEQGLGVDKAPIGPLARAELDLLRGVALLGLHRDDKEVSEGGRLVEEARQAPERMAKDMNGEQRAAFLREFRAWDELAEVAR